MLKRSDLWAFGAPFGMTGGCLFGPPPSLPLSTLTWVWWSNHRSLYRLGWWLSWLPLAPWAVYVWPQVRQYFVQLQWFEFFFAVMSTTTTTLTRSASTTLPLQLSTYSQIEQVDRLRRLWVSSDWFGWAPMRSWFQWPAEQPLPGNLRCFSNLKVAWVQRLLWSSSMRWLSLLATTLQCPDYFRTRLERRT